MSSPVSVAELRDWCQSLIDARKGWGRFIVVLAKDREGNDYSPLDKSDLVHYTPRSTWSGEIDDEGPDERPPNALVLWPVN